MFEHHHLVLEAAQAGYGVAMASVFMVATDATAELIHASEGFASRSSRHLYLSPISFAADLEGSKNR